MAGGCPPANPPTATGIVDGSTATAVAYAAAAAIEPPTRLRVVCVPAGPRGVGETPRGLAIALPSSLAHVGDFAAHLQQRLGRLVTPSAAFASPPLADSQWPALLLAVDGFAVPEAQALRGVLRDGDVVTASVGSTRTVGAETQRSAAVGRRRSAAEADSPRRRAGKRRWVVRGAEEGAGLPSLQEVSVASWPGSACAAEEVPTVELSACQGGELLHALAACGAAFVRVQGVQVGDHGLPDPDFIRWHELWREALANPRAFGRRRIVKARVLKFSHGEDLQRTVEGDKKVHVPDVRYNFGAGHDALRIDEATWDDLKWIRDGFSSSFALCKDLIRWELVSLMNEPEPHGTLGALLASGKETWAGSRLRHSVYPAAGSCTEHTDYGVITLQQSTMSGLEALIRGLWQPLQPPPGCALVFAGDMLERLTNASIPALRHRVRLDAPLVAASPNQCPVARQAHILFLQPDRHTVVQPLRRYLRGDGSDLKPIRYGDWHVAKTSLAFKKS